MGLPVRGLGLELVGFSGLFGFDEGPGLDCVVLLLLLTEFLGREFLSSVSKFAMSSVNLSNLS